MTFMILTPYTRFLLHYRSFGPLCSYRFLWKCTSGLFCFIGCYSFSTLSFLLSFFLSPYFLPSLSLLMYFARGGAPFLLGKCCIRFCLVAVYCWTWRAHLHHHGKVFWGLLYKMLRFKSPTLSCCVLDSWLHSKVTFYTTGPRNALHWGKVLPADCHTLSPELFMAADLSPSFLFVRLLPSSDYLSCDT